MMVLVSYDVATAVPKGQRRLHRVAKACQNTIRMYVLIDGEVIPCLVKAPPSSLGKKDSLMRWLTTAANTAARAGMGTKYQPIQVRLSLRKKEFNSGMTASVIEIQTVRVLDKTADAVKLERLAALYREFMNSYLDGTGRISQQKADSQLTAIRISKDAEHKQRGHGPPYAETTMTTLYRHQIEAIDRAKHGNLALFHECGTGKTLTALHIIATGKPSTPMM
jgi:hypothetical protein